MRNPVTGSYNVNTDVDEDREDGVGVYLEYAALGSQLSQVQVLVARHDKGRH